MTHQQAFLFEHFDEVVAGGGVERAGVQFPGQGEEGLGVLAKILQLKYGLGVREVIFLKVAVQTTAGRTKVWDT